MNILVTGSNGQLGQEIQVLSAPYKFNFIFADVQTLDIVNEAAVASFFEQNSIDICINCAAYTAVDKAESDAAKAFEVNATAVGYLAKQTSLRKGKFIHISTDFVFDGTVARPLVETDNPHPLSVYGSSKLAGEKLAIEYCSDAIILRTSWVYSSFGSNFLKTILRLCKEKSSLSIIYDQIGTPTYARDLAKAILHIISDKSCMQQHGVFHFSNEGVCSWYDFAIAIRNMAGLQTPIYPIETHQYPTPATRPQYSLLNKAKFKATFHQTIPYWQDSLKECFEQIKG